jgi:hypothetical protein
MPPDSVEDSGERLGAIGPYLVERELRRGGMGTVYLVRDAQSEPVALKVALRDDPQTSARFRQEVRATRSLAHPGIVRILDNGEWRGRQWYAMDFVSGVNLADVLAVRVRGGLEDLASLVQGVSAGELDHQSAEKRIGLPRSAALAVMERVVEAVAHAHSRGVLHRDLKPSNILLSHNGDPVLADFGVARDLSSPLRLTADHEVVGTYTYIAPEQLAGEELDERADVYALGAMLYECLTASPPPRRRDGAERLRLDRSVPVELRRIVYQALDPDPNRRTRSAGVLLNDLRRFQRGESVQARMPAWHRRVLALIQRHVVLAASLVALLLVTVFVVVLLWRADRRVVVDWQVYDPAVSSVPVSGLRFQVLAPADGAEPWGVRLGAADAPAYRLVVGALAPGVLSLYRRDQLLWLQNLTPSATLSCERVDDRLVVADQNGELLRLWQAVPLLDVGVNVEGGAQLRAVQAARDVETVRDDWLAMRLGAAAERAEAPVAAQLRARGDDDLAALLQRASAGDERRSDWLLRRGAFVRDAAEHDRHREQLRASRDDLVDRLAYHRQVIAAAVAQGESPVALGPLVDDAVLHLSTSELVVLACWGQWALRGEYRRRCIARLLPHLGHNQAAVQFLHVQAARQLMTETGDLAAFEAAVTELVLAGYEDAWAAHLRIATAHSEWQRCLLGGAWPQDAAVPSEVWHMLRGSKGAIALVIDDGSPAVTAVLQTAGSEAPADSAALVADLPALPALVLGDAVSDEVAVASLAVLAARLASVDNPMPWLPWARRMLRGQHSVELVVSLSLHAREGAVPQGLIDQAAGPVRELMRELYLAPNTVPQTRLDVTHGLGPWLELIAARRCVALGATRAGRERLRELSAHAPEPVRQVAIALREGQRR